MTEEKDKWADLSFISRPMIPASKISTQTGKPIYTRDQLNTVDPLTRLWRHIVFNKRITYEFFIIKWKEFCRTHLNMTPGQVNFSVGNIKSPLYKNTMTASKFYLWMQALGYPVVKIMVETIDDGKPVIFDEDELKVKKDSED